MRRTLLPIACLVLALVGCGAETGDQAGEPVGGDVPTTPRALAAVAAEYTGTPSSADREADAAEEFARGGVGAELRFGSDGEYDGDALTVAVGQGLDPSLTDCESTTNEYLAGCVETDLGVLLWEAEAPEEDPGVVYVAVEKGDTSVLLFYSGPAITGDPRELDLPISVESLFDIASDPRVDVTTSQAAIEAGSDLSFWRG
ncbi:hypothetical protein [Nocardioides nanhaiensis]|uniref:hypothetical protein n=1 Tax=Nocardioides nanhaiensis TaxID=1476871 RepID=UPI0031EB4545